MSIFVLDYYQILSKITRFFDAGYLILDVGRNEDNLPILTHNSTKGRPRGVARTRPWKKSLFLLKTVYFVMVFELFLLLFHQIVSL
jgi:hypothetical protein